MWRVLEIFVRRYTYRSQRNEGLVLLEMLFNLSLAALLLSLMTQAVVSLSKGEQSLVNLVQTDTMWASASRVIREDVHAATRIQPEPGGFLAIECDSRTFQYSVNAADQLVRTQVGGGTAVLAVGVSSINCDVSSTGMTVTLVFEDGSTDSLFVTSLAVLHQ